MVVSGRLGFNPFSSIAKGVKSVGKGVVRVARDPRAQHVSQVAAQQYAPGQYAQAAGIASQVSNTLNPRRPPPMMPQMPYGPPPQPYGDDDGSAGPVQKNHMLLIGGAVAAVVVVLLLMRK